MNLVDRILQDALELPPFPVVMQRAVELIQDPGSSAQQVIDVIQFDQSITFNVLKFCNSAYYGGLRRTVNSLREALVMIGFDQLLEIVLSHQSAQLLQGSCEGYDLEYGELWKHSVACALLSRIVSKGLKQEASNSPFTVALIHDIGKMILHKFVKDYFEEIRHLIRLKSLSFVEAEREVLGIDHAELGGRIAEQWKFPKSIVSAVQYHHTPFLAPENREAVQLVYLCDLIAMMTGIGGGADGLTYHGYKEVMNQYGLKEKDIERFISRLEDQFHTVEQIMKVKEGRE